MEQQNGERLVAMPCAFILFAAKKEGKKTTHMDIM